MVPYRGSKCSQGNLLAMEDKKDPMTTISDQILGDTVGIYFVLIITTLTGFCSISCTSIFMMVPYRASQCCQGIHWAMKGTKDPRTTISNQIQGDTVGIFLGPMLTGLCSVSYTLIFLIVPYRTSKYCQGIHWATTFSVTQLGSSLCQFSLHRQVFAQYRIGLNWSCWWCPTGLPNIVRESTGLWRARRAPGLQFQTKSRAHRL